MLAKTPNGQHCLICDEKEAEAYASYIQAARKDYADPSDDDIEIDDLPPVSVTDDGVWVNAWVWVPNERVTPEEENDVTGAAE